MGSHSHHHTSHVTVQVPGGSGAPAYHVTVPGHTQDQAWAFLETGATGSGTAGWRTTEFARIAEKIRADYKTKLEELDAKVSARYHEMLQGKWSKDQLWRWASEERTKFARVFPPSSSAQPKQPLSMTKIQKNFSPAKSAT